MKSSIIAFGFLAAFGLGGEAMSAMSTQAEAAVDAAFSMEWVESPWGYFDYYEVVPGDNVLRCVGTGQLFHYWY